jgi:CRP/FNR family transcriptional regulator
LNSGKSLLFHGGETVSIRVRDAKAINHLPNAPRQGSVPTNNNYGAWGNFAYPYKYFTTDPTLRCKLPKKNAALKLVSLSARFLRWPIEVFSTVANAFELLFPWGFTMLTLANPVASSSANETLRDVGIVRYLHNTFPEYISSRVFPPGVELFRQGDLAHEVLIMESGLVKLTRSEENGREFIIALRFSDSLLGASTAVSARQHPFTAFTVTSCRLSQISKRHFADLIGNDQQVNSFVNKRLGREVSELMIHITHLACIPVQQRLQQLLWCLTNDSPTECKAGNRIRLPLKYWEVAALLAITPAYLTRLFFELETTGVLSRQKGWIKIPVPHKLWHDPHWTRYKYKITIVLVECMTYDVLLK